MKTISHRRGFATVMVIIMLVLVAACIMSLGILLATQNRRTRSAHCRAPDACQLLLAAAPAAPAITTSASFMELATATSPSPRPSPGAAPHMHISPPAGGQGQHPRDRQIPRRRVVANPCLRLRALRQLATPVRHPQRRTLIAVWFPTRGFRPLTSPLPAPPVSRRSTSAARAADPQTSPRPLPSICLPSSADPP